MKKALDSLKLDGYFNHLLSDFTPIERIIDFLKESLVFNSSLNTEDFRNEILKVQNLINDSNIHDTIVKNDYELFSRLLKSKEVFITSVAFLRAVRPNKGVKSEFLDFHRENFYCDSYIDNQINIHIPILNYNTENSMYIIPHSHLIEDESIKVKKHNSETSGVKKFSTAHKIGIVYNPKEIISGVDFSKRERLKTKPGEAFIFSSKLIHGGGINNSSDVRVSIDFAVIEAKNALLMKPYSFASKENVHYRNLIL